ncbi:acyl-CoA thioesterase [Pseudohoeflea coraliihabitans]|uniref:Acyl-CoA thioesterase n=1 Tax=Pseudohoeflea coraliihabitans TaxID=2860393 RepID=A0ABS6WQ86_9HYPH|nr:thioesterase family protein [Pseudohoeflea sp. DP4N28-3]MBW3097803.1 acyl-CoA thioesterase [Pseudohoeflea sp. DP4N28-3]
MTRPTPTSLSDYGLHRHVPTRWSDNDIYGHMNNVTHYMLFDTAINGWLIEAGLLDLDDGDPIGLVVETGCHFHGPAAFPDQITAGIGVERIGRSSVSYRVGLFRNSEETSFADGRFVHVYVDRLARRPMPLSERWRQELGKLIS